MDYIKFQEDAIQDLVNQFKDLWQQDEYKLPITLKAPTGSGKTYITEKFICSMANQPDWDQPIAYIWITFSDDLAMQSKEKFNEYFHTNLPGRLLTIEDFKQGALKPNDIVFLNWQKLVSEAAENRVNRKPTDERLRKETGYYFEDVISLSKNDGIEFVLIIDESHTHVTEAAERDVINPLNPKIILKVSATPENEPTYSDVKRKKAGFVEISREDVIAEGLIKAEILCQTEEDLKKHVGEDLDKVLLKLAVERREQLAKDIQHFGLNVNPLAIIQLPNDDKAQKEAGEKTKEEEAKAILKELGVDSSKIASWFSGTSKPLGLEDNYNQYDYLLFKTAAGTGWDCPRAQVLVMFRDIHSETFETQTIGRIVRVPVRKKEGCEVFKTGYIYTNHKRTEVLGAKYDEPGNKPKILISDNKKGRDFTIDSKLLTEYIPRADYGDLGKSWQFQRCLCNVFNKYFGITDNDLDDVIQEKIKKKGVDLDAILTQELIINAKFQDFDKISLELKNSKNTNYPVSRNDVQKIFTDLCFQLLREQTDEDAKISNIARSWGSLKSALRVWLKSAFGQVDDDQRYRYFIIDINKGASSIFRECITATLKAYRPELDKQVASRKEAAEKSETKEFKILKSYAFTEDYEEMEVKRCILKPFYVRKEYRGKENEKAFINFIDKQESVEWWMKNGDVGQDWLSFRYQDSSTGKTELFYPDWIIKFKDGRIGIFDTKLGQTASNEQSKDKAEILQKKISYLNGFNRESISYIGGIVIPANGQWFYNDNKVYSYKKGSTEGFKNLNEVFKLQ